MPARIAIPVGIVVAAGAAVIGAAVVAVGTANATPAQDEQYLALLQQHNLRINNAAVAIEAAHDICAALDAGEPFANVVNDVSVGPDRGDTLEQIGFIIGAAVRIYCPADAGTIPS